MENAKYTVEYDDAPIEPYTRDYNDCHKQKLTTCLNLKEYGLLYEVSKVIINNQPTLNLVL